MSILNKHLPLVKEQADFHAGMAGKYSSNPFRASLHSATAEKFSSLLVDLEEADKLLDTKGSLLPPDRVAPKPLSINIEELDGLPADLVKELSLSDADKVEFEIVNIIEELGGVASLDRLLIGLYKRTGEVHKRASLTSRLARMAVKNAIYYVPGKKGVYSTEQLSTEDAHKLFGIVKPE